MLLRRSGDLTIPTAKAGKGGNNVKGEVLPSHSDRQAVRSNRNTSYSDINVVNNCMVHTLGLILPENTWALADSAPTWNTPRPCV